MNKIAFSKDCFINYTLMQQNLLTSYVKNFKHCVCIINYNFKSNIIFLSTRSMLLMREVMANTIYLLVHGKYNYPLSLLMINEDSVVRSLFI